MVVLAKVVECPPQHVLKFAKAESNGDMTQLQPEQTIMGLTVNEIGCGVDPLCKGQPPTKALCTTERAMRLAVVLTRYARVNSQQKRRAQQSVLCCCRTAQAIGWAASTDLLLLFYPVPRNTFLHWLFNTDFPGLVKYHM